MPADRSSLFNLEHLKKEAKRLLRACRAQDVDAIAYVQARLAEMRVLSPIAVATTIKLADIHQALALERGFASWGDLTRLGDPIAQLLVAVRGGHVGVMRGDLRAFAGLAGSSILAASALGDARAVKVHLARDSSLALTSIDGWTALDYVCSSPLAHLSERHAASLCDCAALLLAADADPNTSVDDGRLPNERLTTTMRAILSGNTGLIATLQKGGARDAPEVLQQWVAAHSGPTKLREVFREFFRRPEVADRMKEDFESFKRRGPAPLWTTADPRETPHMGIHDVINGDRHLWSAILDNGADPTVAATGRSSLHRLVMYGPASLVEMFLQRGIDFGGMDVDGHSVFRTAVRAGNWDVVDVLRARGVEDDSTLMDRLIGLCLKNEARVAQALVHDDPHVLDAFAREDADEFVRAAGRGTVEQLRLMLACGFPPDAVGRSGSTALHQAAWGGRVAIVELLLASGASPSMRDELYGQTPAEWGVHGALHAHGAAGPCMEAARLIEQSAAG
jgi:ankyrin repeat protein